MRKVSLVLSAGTFLFMPLGRYPALVDIPADMFVVAALLMLSELLEYNRIRSLVAVLLRWLCRFAVLAVMAAVAWRFGLPSDFAKFDGLIAQPIWTLELTGFTAWAVKLSAAVLMVAFAMTLRSSEGANLTHIALAAVFINVFLPIVPRWPNAFVNQDIAAALDFLLFAGKIALVEKVFVSH